MTGYSALDLSQLPAPMVVETIDYEAILQEMTSALLGLAPELAPALALESEPMVKILQVCAYREMLIRARVNDAAKAVMLAYAAGSDLDHLAALFGVTRLVLVPSDTSTLPAVPAVMEDDRDLRRRGQMALEGFSTAGPRGAYMFHARRDGRVKDVSVTSPDPGTVQVTLLARAGNGLADAALCQDVSALLNADDVRPLCDTVVVQSAEVLTYALTATIKIKDGPDPAPVRAEAEARAYAYIASVHAIGHPIRLSAIYAALHVAGVAQVILTSPLADLEPSLSQAAFCSAVTINVAPTVAPMVAS